MLSSNGTVSTSGTIYVVPSTSFEFHETELVPDNGPFMKILTGNPSRRPITSAPTVTRN